MTGTHLLMKMQQIKQYFDVFVSKLVHGVIYV